MVTKSNFCTVSHEPVGSIPRVRFPRKQDTTMNRKQRRAEEARQRKGRAHAQSLEGQSVQIYFPDTQNPPSPESKRAMEQVTDIRIASSGSATR